MLSGLHSAGRRLLQHLQPGPRVLLYHRVTELRDDPQRLAVTPRHFAEHLQVLREAAHPLPLQEFVAAMRQDVLPPRAVAVTFDDGYADNAAQALPLLQRYAVPATIFIASGWIDSAREFWWDELERVLLRPTRLPTMPELGVDGRRLGSARAREHAYRRLCRQLRFAPPLARECALDELRAAAPTGRASHRAMTAKDIACLAQGGLVQIGAHTASHAWLAALAPEVQQQEIHACRERLEEITGQPVTAFSYPFGTPASYTEETMAYLRAARFTVACANFYVRIDAQTDPFQLPRVLVRDWDGEQFARHFQALLRG